MDRDTRMCYYIGMMVKHVHTSVEAAVVAEPAVVEALFVALSQMVMAGS